MTILTLTVLFAGFVFLETPPIAALFDIVTNGLAIVAASLLSLIGFDMVRNGVELRDTLSGHAIAVTSACDGSGLVVSLFAMTAWLGGRTDAFPKPVMAILAAVVVIFIFNLVRVIVLFLSIGTPTLMLAQHLYVAPLLSSVLVAVLASNARGLRLADILPSLKIWLAIACLGALAWYAVSDDVSCTLATPISNTMLGLMPFGVSQSIACSEAGALLTTTGVLALEPPALVTTGFYPSDFTLAAPLVFASLIVASRGAALPVSKLFGRMVLSVLLFCVAITVAALTIGYDTVTAAQTTSTLFNGIVETYHAPSPFLLGTLKATQNMVVHFNLFILPFAVAGRYEPAASSAPLTRGPPDGRPSRRRRRR
ncbi:hypothetical protein X735_15130 [Mesorhizobium sp. L2C085B000]|uniref:archaeosortase/exosortase family protein n=1 Tax=unclassified Mesorhizobium TaxID=325217 RepID=UPI0003D05AA2|nr:archaeosortase/exosortase family protein [Mesorhizobium sp. L2C085B000]ESZ14927.1 hypothetical protein X735_15130 [Mesorhizobium sp. L2C085B000]